ncbi:hypothetical protein [Guptibacillus hwajinpoensis]|uniref:hypothetical protein n=1 Tax=Guptibacillus hwajinpoensis TaxID=208199 RepID=UPI0037366273
MKLIIGGLLILWGLIILYFSLFKMKQEEDYRDRSSVGISGFLEWELLMKVINKVPYGFAKSFVLIIGASFIVTGAFVI